MDKSQKTVSELIIAGSDAAKFFQFQEKGLYQMPFLIKPPIHIPGIGFIVLGRDTEISTMVGYEVNREITGSGHVIGTLKHTEFKKLVDDLHIPSLYTEISYYHEEIKPYSTLLWRFTQHLGRSRLRRDGDTNSVSQDLMLGQDLHFASSS